MEKAGRVIDRKVARAPFPPHSRWQDAADTLAASLPTLDEVWWVLLPTPEQVASTRGRSTRANPSATRPPMRRGLR